MEAQASSVDKDSRSQVSAIVRAPAPRVADRFTDNPSVLVAMTTAATTPGLASPCTGAPKLVMPVAVNSSSTKYPSRRWTASSAMRRLAEGTLPETPAEVVEPAARIAATSSALRTLRKHRPEAVAHAGSRSPNSGSYGQRRAAMTNRDDDDIGPVKNGERDGFVPAIRRHAAGLREHFDQPTTADQPAREFDNVASKKITPFASSRHQAERGEGGADVGDRALRHSRAPRDGGDGAEFGRTREIVEDRHCLGDRGRLR